MGSPLQTVQRAPANRFFDMAPMLLAVCVQDLLLLSQKGGSNVSAELLDVQRKAKANGAVNHYKVLGVQQTALLAEIKAAYR